MDRKVIQWGTGATGKIAISAIAQSKHLQLVGARTFDQGKVGKDVGEIAGIAPLDVYATDDEEALLEVEADCILWMGRPTLFLPDYSPEEEIAGLCRLLLSGKNLISIVHTPFLYPPLLPDSWRIPIENACMKTGTTFHDGIDPGYISEVLGLTLTSLSHTVEKWKFVKSKIFQPM
ncbi:MAG: hypothetical protein IPM37_13635 [Hahellaceae bacterium]|nr:hypothetical protein [Hahellaceae bacterium]